MIHTDQKGFIKERFIGENIRLTNDIIYECELQNKDGIIILVDFSKAFDVISWDFIDTALRIFGFEEDNRRWIRTLHNGWVSYILQNGYKSDPVTISPYLFVIAAEILSEFIRNNQNSEGLDTV